MRAPLLILAFWAATTASLATAQYPSKPVRLLSPVTAGSGADALARVVARGLAQALSQPVIVENRPGAEGALAARALALAEPDGHTLMLGGTSTYGLTLTMKPAPFEPSELVPAASVGRVTYGLFVHPGIEAADLRGLVQHARSKPAALNYASVNLATDLAASHLMKAGDMVLTKIPYKGGGQAMADLLGGRVHVFFGPVGNGLAHAQEGRLKLIAMHPQRSRLAPAVPTVAEAGFPIAFEPLHYMVLAPGRTPRPVLERLAAALAEALGDPQTSAELEGLGVQAAPSTPDDAAARVREGLAMWRAFLRDSPRAP
jgi:tripartite-type tricarboxylate transporter receptor subunit TctC